ncbi:MAG: nucleoside monophosphate kinase [Candidatus Pacebacteria bacterium]|jgi:adenylate kinase|nr:nucleoside monophosphate kinase [Candidatus Paceibacterota bacterium]
MDLQTLVFIGRSGCGKGTQAKLIMEEIKRRDVDHGVTYIETGERFRNFLKGDSFSSGLSRAIYEKGGLQPEFLAVYMWSTAFVESLKGSEHLVLDGLPRKQHEAAVLDSAFSFYGRTMPTIVHINVSNEWSRERLLSRKRIDDVTEEIEQRLSWFESDVKPAIDWYRTAPGYRFIEVNGERSVEEIHADIKQAILGE